MPTTETRSYTSRARARRRTPSIEREKDVAAVERQQRDQVEQRERHAHEREDLEVVGQAELELAVRDADDPDGAGQLAAALVGEQPLQAGAGAGDDAPEIRGRRARRFADGVLLDLCRRLRSRRSSGLARGSCAAGPTVTRRPSRTTVSVTLAPWLDRMRCDTWENVRVGRPSTATIRSPICRPDAAAGVPLSTSATVAVGRCDGAPLTAKTTNRMTNATRTFAAGPAAMTATRFQVGGAPVGVGSGPLLDVAEPALGRAPRAGARGLQPRRRARARRTRAALRRSPRRRGPGGRRRRPARGPAALARRARE